MGYFKVGDKVIIRQDIYLGSWLRAGGQGIVRWIRDNDGQALYHVDAEGGQYTFVESELSFPLYYHLRARPETAAPGLASVKLDFSLPGYTKSSFTNWAVAFTADGASLFFHWFAHLDFGNAFRLDKNAFRSSVHGGEGFDFNQWPQPGHEPPRTPVAASTYAPLGAFLCRARMAPALA